MLLRIARAGVFGLWMALGALLAGCGGSPEGDLPPADKAISQEEADRIAKQVEEGMKGGYKGAPGAPVPPGAK